MTPEQAARGLFAIRAHAGAALEARGLFRACKWHYVQFEWYRGRIAVRLRIFPGTAVFLLFGGQEFLKKHLP